jgi:hypothetical protein
MTHLVYNLLFWVFYSGIIVCTAGDVITKQTFSKPHVEETVTQTQVVRLKDIDVINPVFIFK